LFVFCEFLQTKNADWLLKNAVNGGRSTEEYRTAKLEKRAQEYRAAEITFAQKINRSKFNHRFSMIQSSLPLVVELLKL